MHWVYRRHPLRDGRWGVTVDEYIHLTRYRTWAASVSFRHTYESFVLPGLYFGYGTQDTPSPLGDIPLAQ